MSRTNTRNTAGMLGVALAGLVLSGSAFAMQPLSQGYLLSASHAGAEGKCGEGKCGAGKTSKTGAAKAAEGKCGEGKCGAGKAAKTGGAKTAEGKCGEGQCGDARFGKTDTDHDGRVSRAEYVAAVPDGPAGFARKDANHDGFISEQEAYDYIKARFKANGKPMPSGLFADIVE